MASLQTPTIVRESGARATRKHRDSPKRQKISAGLDSLIRELLPSPSARTIERQKLLDLFGGHASFACITAWRFGWNAPPQWAIDLLKSKLRKRIAQLAKYESIVPQRGPHGWRGKETLAAWRERKARERDEQKRNDRNNA